MNRVYRTDTLSETRPPSRPTAGRDLRALLVVFGDDASRGTVSRCAVEAGWAPHACGTGLEALARAPELRPAGLVVSDSLPDMATRDLLGRLAAVDAGVRDVLIVGHTVVVPPPECRDRIHAIQTVAPDDGLAHALHSLRVVVDAQQVGEGVDEDALELCGMVGGSPQMRELFGIIERLAPHARTALVLGESGTGKEMVARALHHLGPRSAARMITLDCTLLLNGVVGLDVFGAEAWRGQGSWGLLQDASGGVLFLDAVGDLPLGAQTRLLQALEARGLHGAPAFPADSPELPDVHVFAASDRDLRSEVAAGRFRRDLFYHLNVLELRLPPLRERRADIVLLARTFVRTFASALGKPVRGLTPEAERLILDARWEGNVRELRSVIERACLLAERDTIGERDLEGGVSFGAALTPNASAAVEPSHDRTRAERDDFLRVLEDVGGNKKAAAQRLGLSRRAFYRRLERLQLGETIARRRHDP
ncbi:MAG: sigma 54-interacting transcriptional regulator [Vicinamibacterales bacterium]